MPRIEVDLDLYDVDTEDLVEELNHRADRAGAGRELAKSLMFSVEAVLMFLRSNNAPRSLIDAFEDWARTPALTITDLVRWKEWVGQAQKVA